MILLNSIWLFALAALSIPVAIHLWNIRTGKTLKVGSIALMNTSAQKSSRSFKLHDLLLLLLRCLLLALVAFVLAMPVWQKYTSSASVKGWVLMPKENIKESYQKLKPEIDSLLKAGYEFHYFEKGFKTADLSEVLKDDKNLKAIPDSLNASYWSLVQQLDKQIPLSIPVYLFTPNRAGYFSGERPEVALNLHWKTYVAADSTSTWIAKAWLTNNNDIQVVQGSSRHGGTSYSNYTIRSGEYRDAAFGVNTDSGRLSVSLKNSNQQIVVDTAAWKFAIYTEKSAPDAGYLKAALESVIQFTKHKAVVKQYTDASQIKGHQDWIFWLSQKPVDQSLTQNCDHLFSYEAGRINDVNSWINPGDRSLSPQKMTLYRLVASNNNRVQSLWRDGFGDPVLTFEKQAQTRMYHFYSRLDPAYNDLVWSDNFPKMLLRLIVEDPGTESEYDRREIDSKQLVPVADHQINNPTGKITERMDLSHYLWSLLVLVFVGERWLAHKKAPEIKERRVLQDG